MRGNRVKCETLTCEKRTSPGGEGIESDRVDLGGSEVELRSSTLKKG